MNHVSQLYMNGCAWIDPLEKLEACEQNIPLPQNSNFNHSEQWNVEYIKYLTTIHGKYLARGKFGES